MAIANKATKDGFAVQMQTNHLSHFLLTASLMPALELAASSHGEARIVNHSSLARNSPLTALEAKYMQKVAEGVNSRCEHDPRAPPLFRICFVTDQGR